MTAVELEPSETSMPPTVGWPAQILRAGSMIARSNYLTVRDEKHLLITALLVALAFGAMENGYVESFNGRFRDECLNENWVTNLADAREKIAEGSRTTTRPDHTRRWAIAPRKSLQKNCGRRGL